MLPDVPVTVDREASSASSSGGPGGVARYRTTARTTANRTPGREGSKCMPLKGCSNNQATPPSNLMSLPCRWLEDRGRHRPTVDFHSPTRYPEWVPHSQSDSRVHNERNKYRGYGYVVSSRELRDEPQLRSRRPEHANVQVVVIMMPVSSYLKKAADLLSELLHDQCLYSAHRAGQL